MSTLEKLFQKREIFVGFVVGGDGGIDYCAECCLQLLEGGVDILEIGLPFSDPVADGPVIQRASKRALEGGMTPSKILEIARLIRKKSSAPLVLFSYFNPLLKKGRGYLKELKEAGFDAVLVVDLAPPSDKGESHPFFEDLRALGLDPIFLIAPSTDSARIGQIAEQSRGFLYYACQKGTTGVRDRLPEDFPSRLSCIRKKTELPIATGFGIADRCSASAALKYSDGFVVGSAFVKLMERGATPHELKHYAESIDPRGL